MEEGEKNTAYFCRLEKRRQQSNAIHSLIINDEVDPKLISEEIYSFYSNIYSSSYSENNGKEFLEKVKDCIPQIDIEFKEICDGDLRLDLILLLKKMHLGKSPGQDGLTTNFWTVSTLLPTPVGCGKACSTSQTTRPPRKLISAPQTACWMTSTHSMPAPRPPASIERRGTHTL